MAEYKIAVCEDSAADAEYVQNILRCWAMQRKEIVHIECFPSAESFLFQYEEDKSFEILLLDIEMGKMDGITLAKQLRERKENAQIVFITGYPDYVSQGYDVEALHYLMKPVQEEKMFSVLDRAAANLTKKRNVLLFTKDGSICRLPADEIMYVEVFSHSVSIVTGSGCVEIRKTLGQLEEELGEGFIRCHRSFLVNLRFVAQILKNELVLDNGQALPVARRAQQTVHEAFVSWYKGEHI